VFDAILGSDLILLIKALLPNIEYMVRPSIEFSPESGLVSTFLPLVL